MLSKQQIQIIIFNLNITLLRIPTGCLQVWPGFVLRANMKQIVVRSELKPGTSGLWIWSADHLATLWKAIVDKSGRDYFQDPVFRITSPDVIPSSEVQIHPLRIDIDLSRFVFVGREFFWPVEKFFHRSSIFTGRDFCLAGGEFFALVKEFFHRSRIFCRSRNFFVGREIFLSVENFLAGRECFSWSRSFLVCRSREIREAGREISVGSEVFAPKRSACKSKENCFR